jgi:hypothetical protein
MALNNVMLNVYAVSFILSVVTRPITLSVVMLNVIMLSVVTPFQCPEAPGEYQHFLSYHEYPTFIKILVLLMPLKLAYTVLLT